MTEETLESLTAQLGPIYQKINAIKDRQNAERSSRVIGKCFKFRNSYGGEREKWWLYVRVVGASEHGLLHSIQFQTDCAGRVTAEDDHVQTPGFDEGGGYIEISREEFDAARDATLTHLTQLLAR